MLSLGLPQMHKEAGERRDFLPEFVRALTRMPIRGVVLESGYGAGVGCSESDYASSEVVRFGPYNDCLQQDLVLVLRCPDDDALRQMRRGSVLVSMLHYPTRPSRVALMRELGIEGISLDSIVDDEGQRLVQNLRAVSWNAIREGFRQLQKTHPNYHAPDRAPLRVLVLGCGGVGLHAIDAAVHYADRDLQARLAAERVRGVEVTVVDYDLTWDESAMRERLKSCDMLVDATQRRDATKFVIPNAWLAELPTHAVIVDICVDPYAFDREPPLVKGIEGIPSGHLDQLVFEPTDPAYKILDKHLDTTNRRVVVSCNAWPAVDPETSMRAYGEQILPMMEFLTHTPVGKLQSQQETPVGRALARAYLANVP